MAGAGEGGGALNVGRLSVDVVADLTEFEAKLDEVEKRLGHFDKPQTLKFTAPSDAQIKRLQQYATALKEVKAAGGNPQATGAGPTGNATGKTGGSVKLALDETSLKKAMRNAVVSAFSTPIDGVKLNLDIEHLNAQLQGLHISAGSVTGSSAGGAAQAPPMDHAASVAGLADALNDRKIKKSISDFASFINARTKQTGVSVSGSNVEQKLVSIMSQFGHHLNDIATVSRDSQGYATVTGGWASGFMSKMSEDAQDSFTEIVDEFQKRMSVAAQAPMDLIRRSGALGGTTTAAPTQTHQAPPAGSTASQQAQERLANINAATASAQAATATAQAARRESVQTPKTEQPRETFTIDDLGRNLQILAGYNAGRRAIRESENVKATRAYAKQNPIQYDVAPDSATLAATRSASLPQETVSQRVQRGRKGVSQGVLAAQTPETLMGVPLVANAPTAEEWLNATEEQRAAMLAGRPLFSVIEGARTGQRRRSHGTVGREKGNNNRTQTSRAKMPWDEAKIEGAIGRRGMDAAQGYRSYGRLETLAGADLTDIFEGGTNYLNAIGEVYKGKEATGQLVHLEPPEVAFLQGEVNQYGSVAGHGRVQLLGAREAARREIVRRDSTIKPAELNRILAYASSERGPLGTSDAHAEANPEGRSLVPTMSAGGASIEGEARDRLAAARRLKDMAARQRADAMLLANLGDEDSGAKTVRDRIAKRQTAMDALAKGDIYEAVGRVTSAGNRNRIAGGMEGQEYNPDLGISRSLAQEGPTPAGHALAAQAPRAADVGRIKDALLLIATKGEAALGPQIPDLYDALINGKLEPQWTGEEGVGPGGTPRMLSSRESLWQALRPGLMSTMRDDLNIDLSEKTKAVKAFTAAGAPVDTAMPAAVKVLEQNSADVYAAGVQALFGRNSVIRQLQEEALTRLPNQSGMSEYRQTARVPVEGEGTEVTERRATGAPGEEIGGPSAERRHTGAAVPPPVFDRQSRVDSLERRLAEITGRAGLAPQNDPMTAGLSGGTGRALSVVDKQQVLDAYKAERAKGLNRADALSQAYAQAGPVLTSGRTFAQSKGLRSGQAAGTHVLRQQPIGPESDRNEPLGGEVRTIERRLEEETARELGISYFEGKPSAPSRVKDTAEADALMKRFRDRLKRRIAANPRRRELLKEQQAIEAELAPLLLEKREFEQTAVSPGYRTGAPKVPTADEDIAAAAKAGPGVGSGKGLLYVPPGGIGVTQRQANRLPDELPFDTHVMPGSMYGLNPPGGTSGGGPPGTDQEPMQSGGVVHVWVDNPELTVKVIGGVRAAGAGRAAAAGAVAAEAAETPITEAGPRRPVADVIRELHRAIRAPQLLLPAIASATAGQTQEPPYGSNWMRPPGEAKSSLPPANAVFYGQAPGGGGAEMVSAANAAKLERERLVAARTAGAAVRRPSRTELLSALAGSGADTDTLSRFAAPIGDLELSAGRGSTDILRARQAAKEAQARLPSRALSTSIVQLSQRAFGGREEPEERIFQLQRFTARLQSLDTRGLGMRTQRADAYLEARRAREEIRAREGEDAQFVPGSRFTGRSNLAAQRGLAVPDALRREFEAGKEAVKGHTKEIKENSANISKAAGRVAELGAKAVTAGDVFRNLGAGFVGGVAGSLVTMGVAGAAQAALAAAGVVQEALKPAYEAAIGYQGVTNKVIDSLSDQLRANHGLTVETVALASAQAGLSDGVYQSIAPQLRQAASVEAGNKAYGDYISMVRTAENVGADPTRGLFQATNGLNILGVQTPIGGTPSTMENFLDQFNGVPRATNDSILGLPNFSADAVTNAGMQLGELGTRVGDWIRNIDPTVDPAYKGDQVRSGPTMATRLDQINDQLIGINSDYRVTNDATKDIATANKAQADLLRSKGVDEGKITSFEQLGVAFTDSAGEIITAKDQLVAAWDSLAQSSKQLSALSFLDQSRGAMKGQIWALGAQGDLNRSQLMQQFALQRLANPPVTGAEVFGGIGAASAPPAFTQGFMPGMAQSLPLAGLNAQLQQTGQDQLQAAIGNIQDPAHKLAAQNLVPQLTEVGRLIHDAQVDSQRIQLAQQFRGWNYQLQISKRTLGDIIGLNGKLNQGGVEATEMGTLQYQAQQLSHKMQQQQFDHAELSLNYREALAGFLAPGATGEEIATRVRIAKKETKFERTQLGESRDLADNQWQQTLISNSRSLEAATHDYTELQTQISEAGRLFANQDIIAQATAAQQAITGTLQAYLDEGNGMVGIANQYTQQLIALGKTADEAMADSIVRLQEAAIALANAKKIIDPTTDGYIPFFQTDPALDQKPTTDWTNIGGDADVGPKTLPPQYFPPGESPGSGSTYVPPFDAPETAGGGAGLVDPYLTPMAMSSKTGHTVVINNPSASVDTASLTRVVIAELNRQGSLRNSPLG